MPGIQQGRRKARAWTLAPEGGKEKFMEIGRKMAKGYLEPYVPSAGQ